MRPSTNYYNIFLKPFHKKIQLNYTNYFVYKKP